MVPSRRLVVAPPARRNSECPTSIGRERQVSSRGIFATALASAGAFSLDLNDPVKRCSVQVCIFGGEPHGPRTQFG